MKKLVGLLNTKVFKYAAIMLILAGSFYSCGENAEAGGEVPFEHCSCNEELILWENQLFLRGEVFLFNDYVPGFEHNYIMYDSEYDQALLFLHHSSFGILHEGLVCNFPDFAKKWLEQENGIRVYIEGKMYKCGRVSPDDRVVFDYVLTNLKKR